MIISVKLVIAELFKIIYISLHFSFVTVGTHLNVHYHPPLHGKRKTMQKLASELLPQCVATFRRDDRRKRDILPAPLPELLDSIKDQSDLQHTFKFF